MIIVQELSEIFAFIIASDNLKCTLFWHLNVSENRDVYPPDPWNFNRVFHYKPSILGGFPPIFGNTHLM